MPSNDLPSYWDLYIPVALCHSSAISGPSGLSEAPLSVHSIHVFFLLLGTGDLKIQAPVKLVQQMSCRNLWHLWAGSTASNNITYFNCRCWQCSQVSRMPARVASRIFLRFIAREPLRFHKHSPQQPATREVKRIRETNAQDTRCLPSEHLLNQKLEMVPQTYKQTSKPQGYGSKFPGCKAHL